MRDPGRLIVVAALIPRGARFLMTQRVATDRRWPDCWEFAGGKVDPGEDDMTALRRELFEELAVESQVLGPFWRVEAPLARGRVLDFRVYRCSIEGLPRCVEVQALSWVTLEEAERLPTPDVDGPILARIRAAGCHADPDQWPSTS
jgi:8-oxo-dGTP pyrophosphatase MutT (NUDIX family)